jgi:hypothetical protein
MKAQLTFWQSENVNAKTASLKKQSAFIYDEMLQFLTSAILPRNWKCCEYGSLGV